MKNFNTPCHGRKIYLSIMGYCLISGGKRKDTRMEIDGGQKSVAATSWIRKKLRR